MVVVADRPYELVCGMPLPHIKSPILVRHNKFLDRLHTDTYLCLIITENMLHVPRQPTRISSDKYEDVRINQIPHTLPIKKRLIVHHHIYGVVKQGLPSLVVPRLFRSGLLLLRDGRVHFCCLFSCCFHSSTSYISLHLICTRPSAKFVKIRQESAKISKKMNAKKAKIR